MSQQQTKFEEPIINREDYEPRFSMLQYGNRFEPTITLVAKNPDKIEDKRLQEIELKYKPFGRFLAFHNIGRGKFTGMCYKIGQTKTGRPKKIYVGDKKAQEWIKEKYPQIKTNQFKLLLANNRVVRITSEKYIGIPHSFLMKTVEERLEQEGVGIKNKEVRHNGVNVIYELDTLPDKYGGALPKKVGDEIGHQLSFINSNSGDKSLKFFGGSVVLVCTNGMVSGKAMSELKILHKMDLQVVARKINEEIGKVLEKLKDMPSEFLKLRNIKVTKEEAWRRIQLLQLPNYLKLAIWDQLFKPNKNSRTGEMDWDGTMWGIYMASTYIATHYKEVKKSRNVTKELDENLVQPLQTLETFTLNWDKREKELEKEGRLPKMAMPKTS